jgi:hypothetical protein
MKVRYYKDIIPEKFLQENLTLDIYLDIVGTREDAIATP